VMSAVDLRMGMMVERDEPVDPALIATLQETVRQSIERLRSLLFELRPAALDRDGLVAASRSTSSTPRRKRGGRSRSWIVSSSSPIPSSEPRSTARRRRRWPTPGSIRPPRAWWSR
jgi:signal transduction histidine kinase